MGIKMVTNRQTASNKPSHYYTQEPATSKKDMLTRKTRELSESRKVTVGD